MEPIARYKIIWSETKESVAVPIASDHFFITAYFDKDLRTAKLFGSSQWVNFGVKGPKRAIIDGCLIPFHMHDCMNVHHVMYENATDKILPPNIDVFFDLSARTITYIDKDHLQKSALEFILECPDDPKWTVRLAGDITVNLSESRLRKLDWFQMMTSHECTETTEKSLHLDTFTLSQFTCVMHYVEKGVLVLSMDSNDTDLLDTYRTFDMLNLNIACGYIADVLLSRGDSTIVEILDDINRFVTLRRRFVALMKSGFSRTVLTAIRLRAQHLSQLIVEIFDIIPLNQFIRSAGFEKKRHKYLVDFEEDEESSEHSDVDENDDRDDYDIRRFGLDEDTESSGLGTETESDY